MRGPGGWVRGGSGRNVERSVGDDHFVVDRLVVEHAEIGHLGGLVGQFRHELAVGWSGHGADGHEPGVVDHVGGIVSSGLPTASFPALGTRVTVVTTEQGELALALDMARSHVEALDAAASRFRPDSELARLNRARGRAFAASPLLLDAIEDALHAAELTDGLVTPTTGEAMVLSGYDRDFASVAGDGPPLAYRLRQVPGWQRVRVDRADRTVTVPPGVQVDLGATAKAACADRAARSVAAAIDGGVLVNLGGDLAVAGRGPDGGWPVRIADRHDAPADGPAVTVGIRQGGLATSGTAARRWSRGGRTLHHVIDPGTGMPAVTCWRTVTVAAASCLEANTASTASIVLGAAAPRWLADRGVHARLVAEDGRLATVGGWPSGAVAPVPSEPLAS